MAVAPWAVFWSQLIWNQTMVPPFAALALGGLMLYLAERPRALYLVVSFAAASAMTQVHPGSAVQLATIALALLIFRQRVRWHHVLAGVAVFAALYLPYLVYQIGTGWADFSGRGASGRAGVAVQRRGCAAQPGPNPRPRAFALRAGRRRLRPSGDGTISSLVGAGGLALVATTARK